MNRPMRQQATIFWIGLLVFVTLGMPIGVVHAHADYARSDPAAGAQLATAPAQVQVWFTEELFRREGENRLEVYAPDGSRVDRGDTLIDDDDRTLMKVSLDSNLPDGVYTVRWVSLSADDGHAGEGEFQFAIGIAASLTAPTDQAQSTPTVVDEPTATATPTPAATEAPVSSSRVPGCGSAPALLILTVGAVWVGRRRGVLTR